jgi:hypothetical protein
MADVTWADVTWAGTLEMTELLPSRAFRIANIAATALVTESVTSLFGEAGIGAATVVMTVSSSGA